MAPRTPGSASFENKTLIGFIACADGCLLRRLISSFLISAFVCEMARLSNSFLATYSFFVFCISSRVLSNWMVDYCWGRGVNNS